MTKRGCPAAGAREARRRGGRRDAACRGSVKLLLCPLLLEDLHGGTFARESLRAREVGVADGCSQGVCAVVWPRVVIKGEDVSAP